VAAMGWIADWQLLSHIVGKRTLQGVVMTAEALEGRFAAIVQVAADLLKAHGFRKRGRTFRRPAHGNLEVIEFQRSHGNSAATLRFTLNIGVVSAHLAGERELDLSKAGSADAHLRRRIGDFLPVPDDKWWELSTGGSDDTVIAEITSLLAHHAVPYLSDHSSDTALVRLWESGQSPGITRGLRERYLSSLRFAT